MVTNMVFRFKGSGFNSQFIQLQGNYFLWPLLSDCFLFGGLLFVGPSSELQTVWAKGGKWVGGLKGGLVGGSVPALEAPKPPSRPPRGP